jgi:hypothetical protein
VHLHVLLRTKLASWRPNCPELLDIAEAQLRARFNMVPAERPVPVLACRVVRGGAAKHSIAHGSSEQGRADDDECVVVCGVWGRDATRQEPSL